MPAFGMPVNALQKSEYHAKVLVTFAPTLPLAGKPAVWNGGLSSALSVPCSFALYPGKSQDVPRMDATSLGVPLLPSNGQGLST